MCFCNYTSGSLFILEIDLGYINADIILQANVMLEYNLDDAEQLLDKNLSAATKSLIQVDDDLGVIRDQTTTIEVSILFTTPSLTESPRWVLHRLPALTGSFNINFEFHIHMYFMAWFCHMWVEHYMYLETTWVE